MMWLRRWIASWVIELLLALPYTRHRSAVLDRFLRMVEDRDDS